MKKISFILVMVLTLIIPMGINASPLAEDTIVIDNIRNLNVNENTSLTIDRRAVANTRGLEQYGTGFLSRTLPGFKANISYVAGDNPSEGGELSDINLINSVVGPVTANNDNAFQVLHVNLVVDADTVIEGAENLAAIEVGAIVAASGIESDNGSVRATRIEVLHNGSPYWLITGDVLNLNEAEGFDIGAQHISTSNIQSFASIVVCENGTLENGQKVIVDLEPVVNYTTGDEANALAIICYDDFQQPIDPPNSVFFNGTIDSVNSNQTQIVVNGTSITINTDTQILSNSGQTALEVGMNVSVNGYEDATSSEVIAEFIFINDEPIISPPLPVLLSGAVSNVTASDFSLDGLTITYNNTTQFIEGTVDNLIDGAFVEVIAQTEGQQNPNSPPTGALTAMQITFVIGIPPIGDYVNAQGTVSNLSQNHLQFNLGNETVDLSPNTLFFGTTIEQLADGQEVSVEGLRDPVSQNIAANFLYAGNTGPTDPPGHVCLSGTITTVNNDQSQFTLDTGAVVNVNPQTTYFEGSQSGLVVGVNVDVSGIVIQATDEIDAEVIFFTPGAPPAYVFFSAFINAISEDKTQLTVGDTIVNIGSDTQIVGGNLESLVVGLEVQVDGVVDAQTSEVDAARIILPVTFVSAQGPVLVSDVTVSEANAFNGKVSIMGIEVNQNELTFDPSDFFVNGLAQEQSVIFFGYQDDAGIIWASSIYPIDSQTTPNNPNGSPLYFVSGDVTNVNETQLAVMGINIGNLENAALYDENMFPITLSELLSGLSAGDSINVTDADSYDRATNTLNAGSIYLQSAETVTPPRSANVKATANPVNGSGIVTRVIEDRIFQANFQ